MANSIYSQLGGPGNGWEMLKMSKNTFQKDFFYPFMGLYSPLVSAKSTSFSSVPSICGFSLDFAMLFYFLVINSFTMTALRVPLGGNSSYRPPAAF